MQKKTAGLVDDEFNVNLQRVLAAKASCTENKNIASRSRERLILFYLALARQHWESTMGTGTGTSTKKALTYWGHVCQQLGHRTWQDRLREVGLFSLGKGRQANYVTGGCVEKT